MVSVELGRNFNCSFRLVQRPHSLAVSRYMALAGDWSIRNKPIANESTECLYYLQYTEVKDAALCEFLIQCNSPLHGTVLVIRILKCGSLAIKIVPGPIMKTVLYIY